MSERLSEYVSSNFRLARRTDAKDDRLCPQQRLRFKRQSSFKIVETRESSESFQEKRRYRIQFHIMRYFGNKLHCDQNEKLAMYGCTFFAMSDGCSSKIVKLFSMPKKNAVIIYSHFRLVLFIVVPIFFLR